MSGSLRALLKKCGYKTCLYQSLGRTKPVKHIQLLLNYSIIIECVILCFAAAARKIKLFLFSRRSMILDCRSASIAKLRGQVTTKAVRQAF